MATKTLNTVVALTAALTLSIAGTAMADALVQGGFEGFADNQTVRNAQDNTGDFVSFGEGIVGNEVTTTTGGTGFADFGSGFGGNTRGIVTDIDWNMSTNPAGNPEVFAAFQVRNDTGLLDLSQHKGIALEMRYNIGTPNVGVKVVIRDDSDNSFETVMNDPINTSGGEYFAEFENSSAWQVSDAAAGVNFSDVLSNVNWIGVSFLLPAGQVNTEPSATITIDNLRITPEPSSMIMLGAGCMLLMGSRKLRKA